MITVLIIDDDLTARTYVRDSAPSDWILLEAPDGITGIDLVRQHQRELRLVVLDMHLPDVDGRTICLRIREICPYWGMYDRVLARPNALENAAVPAPR